MAALFKATRAAAAIRDAPSRPLAATPRRLQLWRRPRVPRRRRGPSRDPHRRPRHLHRLRRCHRPPPEARGDTRGVGRSKPAAILCDRAPPGRRAQCRRLPVRLAGPPRLARHKRPNIRDNMPPGARPAPSLPTSPTWNSARPTRCRRRARLSLCRFPGDRAGARRRPAYYFMDYVPSTWPGARLPHVWLADGSAMPDRIGYGHGYTLLPVAGSGDVAGARRRAPRAAYPMRCSISSTPAPAKSMATTSSRCPRLHSCGAATPLRPIRPSSPRAGRASTQSMAMSAPLPACDRGDAYDKTFKSWDHLVALRLCAIGRDRSRALEAGFNANDHHCHLGTGKLARTTLSGCERAPSMRFLPRASCCWRRPPIGRRGRRARRWSS